MRFISANLQTSLAALFMGAFGSSPAGSPGKLPDNQQGSDTSVARARVLVIDDERLVADSLSAILKRFKFDAKACYSGEAAIEAARNECPDYVLSDVVMPKMNGVQTVLQILQICPSARVILLSGNAATGDLLNEARRQGHEFELLAKPVHPEELLRRMS